MNELKTMGVPKALEGALMSIVDIIRIDRTLQRRRKMY
jgi:hypothetical protein